MINFKAVFIRLLINAAALFVVVKTVKGIYITAEGIDGIIVLLAAGAVIGIINAVIRPVILLLTLPINILSLGLFTIVINAVLFALAAVFVKGFEVTSVWGAVVGSLLFSIISGVVAWIIPDTRKGAKGKGIGVQYKIVK